MDYTQLNEIKDKIQNLKIDHKAKLDILEVNVKNVFSNLMQTKVKEIKELVDQVQSSFDLTWQDDEYYQWVRFSPSELLESTDEFVRDLFSEYMQDEYNIYVDYMHVTLLYGVGHAIIINDDGDVYDQDSGEFIIDKSDYTNKAERNKLIETWMESKGYFPSVIYCDKYGSANYVDIKLFNT